MRTKKIILLLICLLPNLNCFAIIEISGSPFATQGAPMPEYIQSQNEKVIIINPSDHVWGAYLPNGKLIRWGIASAGADVVDKAGGSTRTHVGTFRIYSVGGKNCVSSKYPSGGGAPMPYCMYFNGSEAIHGSSEVEFANISHGCIRIHVDDAAWLRNHFVEAPKAVNLYRGTKVIVRAY